MKESKGCFRLGSNPFFVKVLQIWHVYIVFEGIVADNELRGKVMERAFAMLAELLQQEQFELLISEEDQTDHSVETDIRLVYLMNDAVESFLVFHGARMTGILHTDRTETGNVRTVPATQLLLLPGSAGSIYCTKR